MCNLFRVKNSTWSKALVKGWAGNGTPLASPSSLLSGANFCRSLPVSLKKFKIKFVPDDSFCACPN